MDDELTQAPTSEQVTDAFREGFSGTPAEPETATETPTVGEAPAEPVSDPAPVVEPKLATVTEDQLKQLLDGMTRIDKIESESKQHYDKVMGSVGGLQQFVKELREATPAGQTVHISSADLEELHAEFPEMAELTAKGLNRVLGKLKGTGASALKPDDLKELVKTEASTLVESAIDERELRRLAKKEKGWREIVGDPMSQTPYRQWLAQQPVEYQTTINHSKDADEILESITTFQQAAEKPSATSDRERRLKAAVPLKSANGPGAVFEESSGFADAFKKEQRKLSGVA